MEREGLARWSLHGEIIVISFIKRAKR